MAKYRVEVMVRTIVEVEVDLETDSVVEAYDLFQDVLERDDIDLSNIIKYEYDGYFIERGDLTSELFKN